MRFRRVAREQVTEEPDGQRRQLLGLKVMPTFEDAMGTKNNKISLRPMPADKFYTSPAYQSLLNTQQAVETEAELEAKRAQLEALMKRVAVERKTSLPHVRAVVTNVMRMDQGDTDDEPEDPMDEDGPGQPPQPPPRGPRGRRGPRGASGQPGPPGVDGYDGYDGYDGPPGPRGPQGPQGPPGAVGAAGAAANVVVHHDPRIGPALEELVLFLARNQSSRPDEGYIPAGSGGPPPPPPPGGVPRRKVRPRVEGEEEPPMQVDSGNPPSPPGPPGPPAPRPYFDSELIRTNRKLLEEFEENRKHSHQLRQDALLQEQYRRAAEQAAAVKAHERHEEFVALFRNQTNPNAEAMNALAQGAASLHGAATALAQASAQHAASSANSAQQLVTAI